MGKNEEKPERLIIDGDRSQIYPVILSALEKRYDVTYLQSERGLSYAFSFHGSVWRLRDCDHYLLAGLGAYDNAVYCAYVGLHSSGRGKSITVFCPDKQCVNVVTYHNAHYVYSNDELRRSALVASCFQAEPMQDRAQDSVDQLRKRVEEMNAYLTSRIDDLDRSVKRMESIVNDSVLL